MSHKSLWTYDEIPFPNLPAPASQPERLASIAAMRGIAVAEVADARVLELGSASGQNLLPMAERRPGATFVGIDNSVRQTDMAREAASALGLTNVEFRQEDIANLPTDLGEFDYIIAQAVYSWVDEVTRDKLLAVCQRHLAPRGVAYISYNVYPGWHAHDMLRAMMKYEARDARTADETITSARKMLQFLDSSLADQNPYTSTLRPQIAQLMAQSDAYLLHDHLAAINQPVYYRQFVAHARSHGLEPLGEAWLGIRATDSLSPDAEQRMSAIASDPIDREQYRDIVRNRAIRQTLLCGANVELSEPRPEMLDGMYLASQIQPESAQVHFIGGHIERFTTASGVRLSTPTPLVKASLVHLGRVWPQYVSMSELIETATELVIAQKAPRPSADDPVRLRESLLQCCSGSIAELHRQAAPFVAKVSEKPTASPLARWQAQRGDVATNRKHEATRLDDFERHVLPLVDGTRDTRGLIDALAVMAAEGKLVIVEQEQVVSDAGQARRSLELALPAALERLAQNAFLVA